MLVSVAGIVSDVKGPEKWPQQLVKLRSSGGAVGFALACVAASGVSCGSSPRSTSSAIAAVAIATTERPGQPAVA